MRDTCKLGQVVKIQGGYSFQSSAFTNRGIPIIRISNIDNDQIDLKNSVVFYEEIKNLDENFVAKDSDLLIAMSGATTGKAGVYKNTNLAYINQRVGKFIVTKPDKVIYKYLSYWVSSNHFTKQLYKYLASGAQPNISPTNIEDMDIVLPDTKTQERIIRTLDAISNNISNLEALISKQEAIKKTTEFLLLQPKDNWNKITLGDICDITGAGVDKKINPNEERCVLLNYLDVYHKTYIYSSDLHHVVSAPKKQKLRCSVKKNDIFFTPSSETPDDIARSCVAMEDMQDVAYSYHIVRARPKVECNSLFIKYMCSTNDFLLQAQTACVGSGKRYVISLPKFREFVIYMPDIEEQNKIATQLSEIDVHIENLKQQLAKQRAIKQGLMDYFFGN